MPNCPNCYSEKTVKNGHIHNGKQRYKCHECGRQFVENPEKIVISPEKRELIDRLLLERISLAGIARVWRFQKYGCAPYINEKSALVPRQISVTAKKKGKLTIQQLDWVSWGDLSTPLAQCDELWSFVDHKGNKQWVWLGLDAETREIVGVYKARSLWSQQPENYGTLCPQSIVKALLPTPTFGQPRGQSSPVPDIVP